MAEAAPGDRITMKAPRLQILIASFGRRVESLDPADMPRIEGVEYLISCQNPDGLDIDTSKFDARDDIKVHFFPDKGLSVNRNHLLDLATADYLQIADDDLIFRAEGIAKLIETFDAEPDIDIITTRAEVPEPRAYPLDRHDLNKPFRFYHPISFEIAIRRKPLADSGIRFSPLLGIGAPYLLAGEEDVFFVHCLRADMAGIFRNITVSRHPGDTTSVRCATVPGVIRAKGAVMPFIRGYFAALIRLPIEAHRAKVPFFKALLYLTQGYSYFIRHRREI